MVLTRRMILRAGLVGGSLLAIGGGALALQPGRARAPRTELLALSLRSFSVLAAVADRVCPGSGPLPGAWELEVPERVDATLDGMDLASATEFHQALLLLENGLVGLAFEARAIAFTRCRPETQDRVIQAWVHSRVPIRRQAARAITGLISAAYWSHPQTYAHVGYAPLRLSVPPALGGSP